ncbi:MAG: GIY-YIG nuclease family protein [Candidatus Kerfeldbacteria bacterium]|nr:GIY-YIG nuclease family protein [Candidatus Kerfeldbacteria bacterium]
MFYVYLIESQLDGYWYIGFTTHLNKRVAKHNRGEVTSTSSRKPWRLIYAEFYRNKSDALGREKFLKCGAGLRFLKKQLRHHLNGR